MGLGMIWFGVCVCVSFELVLIAWIVFYVCCLICISVGVLCRCIRLWFVYLFNLWLGCLG